MTTTRDDRADDDATRLVRATLALHEAALGALPHGLSREDAEQRVLLFNRQFVDTYALPPDDLRAGVPMRDVFARCAAAGNFSPSAAAQFCALRDDKIALGKPFTLRQALVDGRTIDLDCAPAADGSWVTACRDVTAQQRRERELRQDVRYLDQAIGNMAHGLRLFDADERLVICNDQYKLIYEFDSEAVKPGMTFRDICSLAAANSTITNLSADDVYALRMATVRRREIVTEQIRRHDGRVIERTIRPVAGGGWIADHDDVTTRVRYEEALREQNLLFDATLENVPNGLCAYDKDLRVIVRNQRYLDIYGLKSEDVQPGMAALDMMRLSVARGVHAPGVTGAAMFEEFRRRLIDSKEAVMHRRLAG